MESLRASAVATRPSSTRTSGAPSSSSASTRAEGALGVVLNRPSETTGREAAPELTTLADDMSDVHVGGPVQPSADRGARRLHRAARRGRARRRVRRFPSGRSRSRTLSASCCGRGSSSDTPAGDRASSTTSSMRSLDRRARVRRRRLHRRTRRALERGCCGGRAARSASSRRCHRTPRSTERSACGARARVFDTREYPNGRSGVSAGTCARGKRRSGVAAQAPHARPRAGAVRHRASTAPRAPTRIGNRGRYPRVRRRRCRFSAGLERSRVSRSPPTRGGGTQ